MLDLSKVEAGKVELYYEAVDLADLVDGVVGTIGRLVEASGNRLDVHIHDDGGPVTTDVTRLRQIVLNLLSNANKFSREGLIRLSVRRFIDAEGADLFEIEVTDEGIGMDAGEQALVFEPFAQADPSTTRRFGGTGLGLAICRHFAELLGGDISLESTPGKGTSVTVVLPARQPNPEDPQYATSRSFAPVIAPVIAPDAPLVLVADDDPAARSLVRRQLQRAGYRVATAHDGAEALRMVAKERPDLITLDIMMPGRDGWSVIEALRESPKTVDLPVLMLSVLRERRLALVVGATEYLVKPVPRDVLLSTIQRLIDRTPLVLVVDDDEDARLLTGRRLSAAGLEVAYACNGREALSALESDHPGVIVLDLMMPDMDGFELLEALQDNPNLASIPVVVQTSKMLTLEDRRRFTDQVGEVLGKASTRGRTVIEAVAAALGEKRVGP